ncbi:hypothetical protein [Deinococcus kurensis]|uniref:hypothetical protein n=1 Tax=Deinococcus kurensis TaxID=2662757 RepID=UPI0012D37002|nr:hypothetical protein [Deinococcus kurensis]
MIADTHYTPFKLRDDSQLDTLTQLLNGPLVNGTHTVTERGGLVTITSHYDPASQKPGAVRAPEDVISTFIADGEYTAGVTVMTIHTERHVLFSHVTAGKFSLLEAQHAPWEATLPMTTAPRDSAAYQSR